MYLFLPKKNIFFELVSITEVNRSSFGKISIFKNPRKKELSNGKNGKI